MILTDWQLGQLGCDCSVHRYHVVHLCLDHGRAFTHSQADCDEHRGCRFINFDPKEWKHSDTTETFVDRLYVYGTFGPWHEAWEGSYFQAHWGEEQSQ